MSSGQGVWEGNRTVNWCQGGPWGQVSPQLSVETFHLENEWLELEPPHNIDLDLSSELELEMDLEAEAVPQLESCLTPEFKSRSMCGGR